MADLTQDQWQEQLSNDADAVILDVRTDEELEEGFIPNAVHIDIYQGQEFINQVEALDKNKTYYVYCRSGNRSGQACAIMNQLGFTQTHNLLGGFNEWEGDVANH
ncbi:rhodanese-like domain-containing protein [Corallibacter sp.]|uniref:rhodanese-like domain-containing protein n=1 Tax=Corallibacter sp. TaxID=2038084 RepID=UPI003AB2A46B